MSTLTSTIPVERIKSSRISEVDFQNLEFGAHLSDHMLIANFEKGQWTTAKIVPFGEIRITPAMLSLHYGQAVFEGSVSSRRRPYVAG